MRASFLAALFLLLSSPALAFNASHYGSGDGYYGKRTACGNIHRPGPTTAHRSLPCWTVVKITNKANGKSGFVVVTDRGPFVRGRVWDLNSSFAASIGCGGVCNVSAEVIGP